MFTAFSRAKRRHHRKLKKRATKLGVPVADLRDQEYRAARAREEHARCAQNSKIPPEELPPEFEGRTYEDINAAFQEAWSDNLIRRLDLYDEVVHRSRHDQLDYGVDCGVELPDGDY